MATKPSEVTTWATSGSALRTATDSSRWNLGWQTLPDNLPTDTGERPNLNQQNYWQFAAHQWFNYLETFTDELEAAIVDSGTIPLGSIFAIASNLTGSHPIPATGTVDATGWQYCDGAAIDGSAEMSGTIPNLTGSIFLMGSTVGGNTGGTNDSAHTHTLAHTHATDSQLGTITLAHGHTVDGHTHNMAHTHQWCYIEASGTGLTSHQARSVSTGEWTTGITKVLEKLTNTGTGVTSSRYFAPDGAVKYYTSGALNNAGSVITNTGSDSPGTDSKLSNFNASHSHTTNSQSTATTSAASSTENRPNFISVVYLMRVK